jgi:hypothetical protein
MENVTRLELTLELLSWFLWGCIAFTLGMFVYYLWIDEIKPRITKRKSNE